MGKKTPKQRTERKPVGPISDVLRRLITIEKTYAIAKGSGLGYPVLYRWVHGQRQLSEQSLNKLAEFLDLKLRP